MSIFEVEVDPKAIEAAAQDDPPEYIPTDGRDATADGDTGSPNPDENAAPGTTADALATAAAIAATTAGTEGTTTDKDNSTTTPTSNLDKWKEFVSPEDGEPEEEDIDFPEPSMDDFFHDDEEQD